MPLAQHPLLTDAALFRSSDLSIVYSVVVSIDVKLQYVELTYEWKIFGQHGGKKNPEVTQYKKTQAHAKN